ncbi:MAG: hypothetical protein MUE42_11575 [Opitutaceae bacterium]|jgi:hypothetical protein|nr:hypothetical protein [Opitutaceae bacterium]
MDLQTLVDRSPFAPPGTSASGGAPVAEQGTLEFRGMVVDESGTAYSVFDASANRGFWIREGEKGPIQVKSYQAADNLLEVDRGGQAVKLQLKRATIQAGAPIAIKPAVVNAPPRPQNGATPNAAPAAADTRRLEAVAAEVRRRRALRNAAATGQPAPAATPAPAPATSP